MGQSNRGFCGNGDSSNLLHPREKFYFAIFKLHACFATLNFLIEFKASQQNANRAMCTYLYCHNKLTLSCLKVNDVYCSDKGFVFVNKYFFVLQYVKDGAFLQKCDREMPT